MQYHNNNKIINFLQEELAISTDSIALALNHHQRDPGPLPLILWQYGLISLKQLQPIKDLLER